jgi:aspartyl-tRNA(Asn)/glutamyl-tRNA(Gln) amidotransferase subunit B
MHTNTNTNNSFQSILETHDLTVGLEVHCQINTVRKAFSMSAYAYGQKPNSAIDPTSLGLPGALPTINTGIISAGVALSLALQASINKQQRFVRKHYFYPDLPKGYQISQLQEPMAKHGKLTLDDGYTVHIEQIQLEEDAGKSIHMDTVSLVDFNRSGVGLIEIITTPCIHNIVHVGLYLKKLHSYLIALGICHGSLEKGEFRVDANVSIAPKGSQILGQRTEIKNVNSFKYVEKAIMAEVKRQFHTITNGGTVEMETLGYDSDQDCTVPQRKKEGKKDYRFFPDPDLPVLVLDTDYIESIQKTLPEMPDAKIQRFQTQYHLSPYDAQVLNGFGALSVYFERLVGLVQDLCATNGVSTPLPKKVCNFVTTEVLYLLKQMQEQQNTNIETMLPDAFPIGLDEASLLLYKESAKQLTGKQIKEIIEQSFDTKTPITKLLTAYDTGSVWTGDRIREVCMQVLNANPTQVGEYLGGKEKLYMFFVGQIMKQTQGSIHADSLHPVLKEVLTEMLQNMAVK